MDGQNAPSDSVWSIDLERHKGKVWLQNGWPEFAEFYAICFGYLLIFEYQGDSNLQVHIFDPSSSEIDYPLTSSDKLNFVKSTQVKKRVIDIDDSSSSDGVVRPCKKTKTRSPCIEAKLQQGKDEKKRKRRKSKGTYDASGTCKNISINLTKKQGSAIFGTSDSEARTHNQPINKEKPSSLSVKSVAANGIHSQLMSKNKPSSLGNGNGTYQTFPLADCDLEQFSMINRGAGYGHKEDRSLLLSVPTRPIHPILTPTDDRQCPLVFGLYL